MSKPSKRIRQIHETIQKSIRQHEPQNVLNAINLLKDLSTVKFAESVDVSVILGVDTRKSDQVVRGAVLLPHGTGRQIRVAVLAEGAYADAAKEAEADIIGFNDLFEDIKAGNINFDVLIATPESMAIVGKLGPILGPRGLMPNPKVGTVTTNVSAAVKNIKKGQIQYKTDKNGIVHCRIGDVKFSTEDLVENLRALIGELKRVKPTSSKGIYLKKIVVSTTMGPGLIIDLSSLG
jgi:large subunit ribosomal protein L1